MGGGTLTEVEVDLELTGRRAAQPGWVETSFSTIAGAGPNGAIIHYRCELWGGPTSGPGLGPPLLPPSGAGGGGSPV